MRALLAVVALIIGFASTAAAQLAAPQAPSQRLLVLPFQASTADSAASIALADAIRDRLTALTKNKVLVVPKAKLCEALKASGFPCDGLLDDQQARQLARFLQVHSYLTGSSVKEGSTLKADVHLIDIASSGMSGAFAVADANPGTTAALAELIAQRVAAIVRISEPIRNCNDERKKSQFARARAEANKALAIDRNSTGAHLCLATIYETQRKPDSVLVESQLALAGDSLNGTAWENIFRIYQQRGDTIRMVDALIQQLRGEPRNVQKRLGIAQLLRQMKQFDRAVAVIDDGLKVMPGDTQLIDLKLATCNEAGMYACSARAFLQKAQHDTTLLADTAFIKPAIGAAQQASDTLALDFLTAAAVRRFPNNASFQRTRAAAYDMRGKQDSALIYLSNAAKLEPNDLGTSLQIAKIMIDRAVWDTTGKGDTAAVRVRRVVFAQKVDSAKPYLRPGLTSSDSTQRLAAAVIMLTGGSKLAQAGAYDAAYPWLDTLLQVIAPRNASDTLGPKQQVRINASFWYGLSSVLTLNGPYQTMTKAPKAIRCDLAHQVFNRLTRTKAALQLGRRVHPPTADQMLGFVTQYEKAKPSVQGAFKCRPPLN